jgi:hypothetical protein
MIKKLLGFFICMLLFTSVLSVMGISVTTKDIILKNGNLDVYIPGDILLNTTWHEKYIYASKTPINYSLPPDHPNRHYRLGCWSAAIGQIMNYHQLQSHGSVYYVCNEIENETGDPVIIQNNLDSTKYFWFNMPSAINESSPPEEIDNVTTILYDTATVIQKDFGTGKYKTIQSLSNWSLLINELRDHFECISIDTIMVDKPPISDIINEIDNFRPCMLLLRQNVANPWHHAVVLDGYDWVSGGFQVHVNYGWGGDTNGFYEYDGAFPGYGNTTFRKLLFIRLKPRVADKPAGPEMGEPGMSYTYRTKTTAPYDTLLYFKWDWGDGSESEWFGRYESGEICEATHSWKEKGTYDIKVKAKDINGYESDWSEPLSVKIPRGRINNNSLLIRVLKSFPNVLPILRYILGV